MDICSFIILVFSIRTIVQVVMYRTIKLFQREIGRVLIYFYFSFKNIETAGKGEVCYTN
jgi:hypothetical protein